MIKKKKIPRCTYPALFTSAVVLLTNYLNKYLQTPPKYLGKQPPKRLLHNCNDTRAWIWSDDPILFLFA